MAERGFFSTFRPLPIPTPPHTNTTHAAMYAVFLGMPQTQLLPHVLHPLKGRSRLYRQCGKPIHCGGPKPTTKSPLLAQGHRDERRPWGMASCFGQNRSWGTFHEKSRRCCFHSPTSNMRAKVSLRHPIPYCATTGGRRIGSPQGVQL